MSLNFRFWYKQQKAHFEGRPGPLRAVAMRQMRAVLNENEAISLRALMIPTVRARRNVENPKTIRLH